MIKENKLQNYMEPSDLSPKRKVTSETHYDLTDLKMFKLIQTKRHSERMRTWWYKCCKPAPTILRMADESRFVENVNEIQNCHHLM